MTAVEEAAGLESAAPPTAARFPALDGLRGLAALAVVSTHVGFQTGRSAKPGALGALLARGDFGVTVFFLLSGFLLYRPLSRAAARIPTYARRRSLRVLPVYYVAVVVAFLLLPGNDHLDHAEWWEHLLLVQVYLDTQLPDGLTQMWSLCTEVAFYVALPLFAWVVVRVRRARRDVLGGTTDLVALAGLYALGAVWSLLAADSGFLYPTARLWLPGYADWFALGMGLAVLHHRSARTAPDRLTTALRELGAAAGTCLAIAVLLLALACTDLGGPRLLDSPTTFQAVVKHQLYGLSALFFLLPAVFAPPAGTLWSRLLASRPLHAIGQVSYSVFALHLVVLYYVVEHAGGGPFHGHFATVWLLTVGLSLVVSTVSYHLVEKPMIALGRRA